MITEDEIKKIAKLAKLSMPENESKEFAEQLSGALKHFEQMTKINTDGIEPLVTPTQIEHFLRPDQAVQEISADKMVENAPEKIGNLFKVPPVV